MNLTGKIIKGIGGFYYVDAAGVLYETRARGLFRKQGITPLVGDVCTIDVISETERTAYLVDIEERSSELIRPAVANVDQALVIFACAHPVPSTGLLDRFLINMELQQMKTIIVLSKVDLLMNEAGESLEELQTLCETYRKAGYQVIELSNVTGDGLDDIREAIDGKLTVLSGPSGVGKSSLINSLIPGFNAETGDISKKLRKGKNTTRHTEIIPVPDMADTFVIDTPGYSSIELMVEDESDVKLYMREFEGLNETCRFTGCSHIAEPGCSVKEKVEEGAISQLRYESYIDMFNEVKARRKW
ncbi:ribosome biogenesis GTPase [Lachnospiraceae bacterium NE2001]|nr:ribosome biogenesis GTPase [Lachnospiraceae bacterium NE2001]